MSFEFLLTSLIVAIVPGTGVVYTVSTALVRGRTQGIAAAIGCTLGILPAMLAAVLGVAAVLHTSAILFNAMKLAGAAYLLYLAWITLRSADDPLLHSEQEAQALRSSLSIVWGGFAINILNPKLSAFFLALLPQFIDPASPQATAAMLLDGLAFMLITLVVFTAYVLLAATARDTILQKPGALKWLRRTFAAAFAAFGLRLALAERG